MAARPSSTRTGMVTGPTLRASLRRRWPPAPMCGAPSVPGRRFGHVGGTGRLAFGTGTVSVPVPAVPSGARARPGGQRPGTLVVACTAVGGPGGPGNVAVGTDEDLGHAV